MGGAADSRMLHLGSIARDFQLGARSPRTAHKEGWISYEFCICNDDLLRAHIATQIVFF
jgi:hypothetical protein